MANKDETNIIFLNHDLRNNIGAAISHVQLLTMLYPELSSDENITAIVENLKASVSLSENISVISKSNESAEALADNDPRLTLFPLDEKYFEMVNASYEKLTRMHPIKIKISFETVKGDYFIRLNMEALNSLRENLISNSINAGATTIYVHYDMKEYGLIVTFNDNGSGMDQEGIDKLILSQHGDGVIHGVGTKSILKIAKDNGFFISYNSDKDNGTTYRALCPYANV